VKRCILVVCVVLVIAAGSLASGSVMDNNTIDNTISRYVLPNGMVVLLKEDHRNPVVSLEVWVKTGSITEGKLSGSGVTHFVEHMLFKGTTARGVGELAKEIQSYGGEINARTSPDTTVYTVNIDSRYFMKACGILADALMHAAFDQAEVEKERSVIVKEINLNDDDPERRMYKTFFNTAYAVHPYKDPVIGYEEVFTSLTRDDVLRYFSERYVPNNMVVVAVGDFDQREVYRKLQDMFKGFARKSLPPVFVPAEPAQLGPRVRFEEGDVNKAYLFLGFHTVDIKSPDKCALDVISMILGEGRSSRLYQKLREQLSLVSGISSWSYTPLDPGVLAVSATFEPDKYPRVREAVLEELYRLKTEAVSAAELEKVKQQIISEYYFSLDTVAGQASDIGYCEVATGNCNYFKEYVERVKQVSAEDVRRVAQKYFTGENLTEAGLFPRGKQPAAAAAIRNGAAAAGIQKFELPNGLKLLVREDHTLPTVSVRALLKGGLIVEDEKDNGISHLCAQLLLKGTPARSGREMVTAVESAGGAISSYSANNSFGCSVDILAGRKDLAVETIADALLHPAFRDEDIAREKNVMLLNIKSLEDQPFQAAFKLFRETMFQHHPYRFQPIGTAESVRRITRDDLVAFHKKYVVPENMVLAVFGDVNAAEVRTLVEAKFGGLARTGLVFPRTKPEFKKSTVREYKPHQGKQAVVLLGYRGVDIFNPAKYTFEVLDAVFSGQGSRLFASVRDEEGLAYAVGSQLITGLDPGAFVFFVGTVPEKVDRVIELMLKEVRGLRERGIGQDELQRTKNGLVGIRKIQLQANGQLALQAGLDELYGLGYDDYLRYYDRINGTTEQDIIGTSKKYFTDDDYVIVVLSPERGGKK